MNLVDDEDSWDGPKYVAEHVYSISFMAGSQLINEMTDWNGKRAFELIPSIVISNSHVSPFKYVNAMWKILYIHRSSPIYRSQAS